MIGKKSPIKFLMSPIKFLMSPIKFLMTAYVNTVWYSTHSCSRRCHSASFLRTDRIVLCLTVHEVGSKGWNFRSRKKAPRYISLVLFAVRNKNKNEQSKIPLSKLSATSHTCLDDSQPQLSRVEPKRCRSIPAASSPSRATTCASARCV